MPSVNYLYPKTSPVEAEKSIYTSREAATFLGLSPRTLERYRTQGTGPLYIDVNHKIKLYPKNALYRWMAERIRKSTSDTGIIVMEHHELLPSVSPLPTLTLEGPKRGRPKKLPPVSETAQQSINK